MNLAWLPLLLITVGAHAQSVYHIDPGPDLQYELQEKLITAVPGDVIELGVGLFLFHAELNVSCDNLTIRGAGADKTILSFKGQQVGSEGITATGNGFIIEDLAVEDTAGDAIKVLGADGVIFRRVRAEWTNGPDSNNGAYGIYPVECSNVLIEDCVAIGASDAGIYVGQSKNVIVRRCRAEFNVAGIEIENTVNADVYDCIATNNTGGLLVFDLPGLPAGNGHHVRVFRNRVFSNNTPNFAAPGNIVGMVPTGTGVMVMAVDHVEVYGNDIRDNDTANLVIVSYLVTERPIDDPAYDPFPEFVDVHDNVFEGGGESPSGQFGLLFAQVLPIPLPDILFDGIAGPAGDENILRMDENGDADFANFDIANLTMANIARGKYAPKSEIAPYAGRFDRLKVVTLAPFPSPADGSAVAAAAYRAAPRTLSEWGLFKGSGREQEPEEGVLAYDLNTELFADHASKHRFIRLPKGTAMGFSEHDVLEFPSGTVIAKTFSYPTAAGERLLETRIQELSPNGWHGFSYQWNVEQTEAVLVLGGGRTAGKAADQTYEIPNANQCLSCHDQSGAFIPLGPKARNLNRDGQLERWAQLGLLTGLPTTSSISTLPVWHDEATGSLDDRARAWLDVNCAHCHNPVGTARTTGLDLSLEQSNLAALGVLKTPVAAGRGSAGRAFDIVPGKPDESILLYRIESDEPSIRMPTLGRNLADQEAIALIRAWIEAMPAPSTN
jgi:parallel beta-helix repeat protein